VLPLGRAALHHLLVEGVAHVGGHRPAGHALADPGMVATARA
jgi:hypothetical protein